VTHVLGWLDIILVTPWLKLRGY
jgi:hypothetical protein